MQNTSNQSWIVFRQFYHHFRLRTDMSDYPPSHFKGWNPVSSHHYDKLNRDWAMDERYKQLGACFDKFLLDALDGMDKSCVSINKNRPNTRGGTYQHKRYVRIVPNGFHANGLQIFIESFCEKTPFDNTMRDPSDAKYSKMGFPIPENSMGIFIGMSAISHFTKGEKWGIEDSISDFDVAREFFYDIEEKMADASQWALEFTGSSDDFAIIQDSRVQRIRVKLPNLDLDSGDWDDCRMNEGLSGLISIFGDLFVDYSQ